MSVSSDEPNVFHDFFISPGIDVGKTHRQINEIAKANPQALVDRWKSSKGKELLNKWETEDYSREALDKLIGRFYQRTDIRGIPLYRKFLRRVDLSNCDMFRSDLSKAHIESCNLNNTHLSEANLKGTHFPFCLMEDVYVDQVEYDEQTDFHGVLLDTINFNLAPGFKRHLTGKQKIDDLKSRYPNFARVLRITCNYGRSFWLFAFWCLVIILVFAIPFSFPQLVEKGSIITGLYVSVTTFTTIGSDLSALTNLARYLIAIESLLGYVMGSLLIGIIAKRIMVD